MNSFNHYAYGAIGDWMYRVSAGIETTIPGYKHIKIQPHPAKKLDYSRATFNSPYGMIASGWERNGDRIIVRVTIPANTTATIIFPGTEPEKIKENGIMIQTNKDFGKILVSSGNVSFEVGSGEYIFEYTSSLIK